MKKLLDVKPPELGHLPENSNQGITINSICMSLKSIKLVQDLLHANLADLGKIKDSYAKYVSRIKFIVENRPKGQMGLPDIFAPNPQTLKVDPIEGISLGPDDFKVADHYLVLQETSLKDVVKREFLTDKWQQALSRLLLEVDLSAYHNSRADRVHPSDNELLILMKQITKHPRGFVSSKDAAVKVGLLAHYLCEIFGEKNDESVAEAVEELRSRCEEAIGDLLAQSQSVERSTRTAINKMGSRHRAIREANAKYVREAISGMIAEHIVKKVSVPFRINCEQLVSEKPKSKLKVPESPYHTTTCPVERNSSTCWSRKSLRKWGS